MASPNRPARLNRTVLLLAALILLAAAAFTLLTAFDLLHLIDRGAALTPASVDLTIWAPYLTILAALVVAVLTVRWLFAQTRRRAKTGTWRMENDPAGGATHLDARTAAAPLVDEIETYPGVHHVSARLAGTSVRPILYLTIGTDDDADITDIRRRIDNDAIPHLRQALDLDQLPAQLLFRLDDARAARLS